MDVAAPLVQEISRETGHREAKFSAEGGDKLITTMRPILDTSDSSVNGKSAVDFFHRTIESHATVYTSKIIMFCNILRFPS